MTYPDVNVDHFVSYFETGKSFFQSFEILRRHNEKSTLSEHEKGRSILPMAFLLSHSLECHFKAYLVLCGIPDIRKMRDAAGKQVNGHDLKFLCHTAEEHKLFSTDDAEEKIRKSNLTDEKNTEASIEHLKKEYGNHKDAITNLVEELHNVHGKESEFANRYLRASKKNPFRYPAHYNEKIIKHISFLEMRNEDKYKVVTGEECLNRKVEYPICEG